MTELGPKMGGLRWMEVDKGRIWEDLEGILSDGVRCDGDEGSI